MKNFGLIGYNLSHSMSPFIHKLMFEINSIDGEYKIYEINPQDFFDVKKREHWLKILKTLDGFNVTIPHKETMLNYLHKTDENVDFYKSTNTIKVEKNPLSNSKIFSGYNTDAYGFTKAITSYGMDLLGDVAVLGSGGVSKTMAYEASKTAKSLIIVARNLQKANVIMENIITLNKNIRVLVVSFDEFNLGNIKTDLIVNGTPVGMYPKTNVCPVSEEAIKSTKCVFDAIYNPKDTIFIKTAAKLGKKTLDGMSMLVHQAAYAQNIWYGAEFSKDEINYIIESTQKELGEIYAGK